MSFDTLDPTILAPAFLAGLLVLATHIPLGQIVLARGIIFLDLAVAQIAGLGVVAAHSFALEPNAWEVQLAGGGAALVGALLLALTEHRWPKTQEAFIGCVFVLAASASVLMLASNPHGGEHLRELLVGQILWVNYPTLLPVAGLYALILAVWWKWRGHLPTLLFYVLFALAVMASVQLVGIYLVFASLIMPALATHRWRERTRLPAAYALGVVAYAIGLVISALFDVPAGAVIVLLLGIPLLGLFTRAARENR